MNVYSTLGQVPATMSLQDLLQQRQSGGAPPFGGGGVPPAPGMPPSPGVGGQGGMQPSPAYRPGGNMVDMGYGYGDAGHGFQYGSPNLGWGSNPNPAGGGPALGGPPAQQGGGGAPALGGPPAGLVGGNMKPQPAVTGVRPDNGGGAPAFGGGPTMMPPVQMGGGAPMGGGTPVSATGAAAGRPQFHSGPRHGVLPGAPPAMMGAPMAANGAVRGGMPPSPMPFSSGPRLQQVVGAPRSGKY